MRLADRDAETMEQRNRHTPMISTLIEPLEARIAPATFIVSNNLDAGPGSLRQAILDANAQDGIDTIELRLSSSLVIKPSTPLPAITDTVDMFRNNGSDEKVSIDGSNAPSRAAGLELRGSGADGSKISGFAIYGFVGSGIEIQESSMNVIEGNYLGILSNGTMGYNTRMIVGVSVRGGSQNEISGNVIGGNTYGIQVRDGALDTSISVNDIGFARTNGLSAIPNVTGIFVFDASRTTIERNTITGNVEFGIELTSAAVKTEIYDNHIGVVAQSSKQVGTQKWGIYSEGAADTRIGEGDFFSPFNRGNIITGNTLGGIYVTPSKGSPYTWIEGNTIGALYPYSAGNGGPGILAADNLYSGGSILTISSNLIANNEGAGVEIRIFASYSEVEITSNLIGTDTLQSKPLGNGTGIIVEGAAVATIGGPHSLGNTIVASKGDGILIKNNETVRILGNNIGYAVRTDGSPEFGNAGHGIHIVGTGFVHIGDNFGQTTGNIITSNGGDGIRIDNSERSEAPSDRMYTQIVGNFVGTDGLTAKGNLGAGIHVLDLAPNAVVTIGDSGPTPNLNRTSGWNVVSGNHQDGILVERADEVSIRGNYVGTDYRGLYPIGNGGDGIALIDTNWATISGGKSPSIIAANLGHGVSIIATSADSLGNATSNGNSVRYTNVGLGADGNTRMENGLSAIVIDKAASSSIGGGGIPSGNRIYSQNVALQLDGAGQTSVFDNEFRSISGPAVAFDHGTWGTEFGGDSVDGSKAGNVVITESSSALLIADGSSNSIANNRLEAPFVGISVLTGIGNMIYDNRFAIAGNGLFIDLGGDGVTPNDPLDADSGPNDLLNSPSLIYAAVRDGRTLIRGEYRGTAEAEIVISWYVNGQFLAESAVQTDATGVTRLALDLNEEFEVGAEFRACVIGFGSGGLNTSEFSNAVLAVQAPDVIAKGAAAGQKARAQLVNAVTGEAILEQLPFGKGYRGGVSVATADVDGDGFTDLIATQRKGDGVVKIYSGLDGHLINSFWLGAAKGSAIRSLAVGDLDGDGSMEIVTGLGHTKGGRILVHDALTGVFEADFAPFGDKTPNRLSVGLSDTDGDNHPEIIVLSGSKRVVLDPMSGQIEQLARLVKGRAVA